MADTIYDQDWDDERQMHVSGRKVGLPLGRGAPHYPNKAERAELKRLMKAGRCDEDEVRASKGNRQKLAKAAKSPMQKGTTDRRALQAKRRNRQRAKSLGVEVWELDPESPQARERWY
jgi:hypothetical protein